MIWRYPPINLVTIVALAASMAGCGAKGPSSGTESQTGADLSQSIQQVQKISQGDSRKTTYSTPAYLIFNQAVADLSSHHEFGKYSRKIRQIQNLGGWPGDPENRKLASELAATAEFSNAVAAVIFERLNNKVFSDKKGAIEAVKSEIMNLGKDNYLSIWHSAEIATQRRLADRYAPDYTDAKGAAFWAGETYYHFQPTGLALSRNDSTVFGGGFINGRKIDIAMDATDNLNLDYQASGNANIRASAGSGSGSKPQ